MQQIMKRLGKDEYSKIPFVLPIVFQKPTFLFSLHYSYCKSISLDANQCNSKCTTNSSKIAKIQPTVSTLTSENKPFQISTPCTHSSNFTRYSSNDSSCTAPVLYNKCWDLTFEHYILHREEVIYISKVTVQWLGNNRHTK